MSALAAAECASTASTVMIGIVILAGMALFAFLAWLLLS